MARVDGPRDEHPIETESPEAPPPRRSSARGALTLMGGTLASRVTGLLRNSLLNQLFPVGVADAFTVALKVPNLFRELLAEGALTNSFVPVYKGLPAAEAKRLSGALLSLLLLVNALLTLAAVAAAPWVVRLLLGAEGSVDYELAVRLARVVFPFLPAISLSAWAMGVLNAEERFLAPAWAPVALNVVASGLMLAFPGRAVPLALAFVLGALVQFVVQLPAMARHGLLPRPRLPWHPELAGVLLLMLPFAFTTSGRQVLNVVATRLLDALPAGSQLAFFNADLFLSLALGLFSVSPALAWYSRLADDAARAPERFAGTLLGGLRFITFLTVPAGLLLWLLAAPATRVVFDYLSLAGGGAEPQVLRLTALATAPLGLAVFPLGLVNLLIRSFYVRRAVRLPVLIVVATLALHALLYALAAPRYGIAGMSWATVVVAWTQLAVLLTLVRRREGLELLAFARFAVTVALAAGAALAVGAGLLAVLPWPADWWGALARVVVVGGATALLYAGFGALLGLRELRELAARLRR